MHKIILIIALSLSCLTIQAQTTPIEHKVSVDSVKKETLYRNYLTWVAKSFNSSNNVIQLKNEVDGIVILKCVLNTKVGTYSTTHCTIELNVKDNKYRLLFYDIYVESPKTTNSIGFYYTYQDMLDISSGKKAGINKVANRFITDVNIEINNIIQSISNDIIKTKQTNW
jgi:hypothetical protein